MLSSPLPPPTSRLLLPSQDTPYAAGYVEVANDGTVRLWTNDSPNESPNESPTVESPTSEATKTDVVKFFVDTGGCKTVASIRFDQR